MYWTLTLSRSAGSETTASLLAGLTHWLIKTPRAFDKLKAEIRSIETAAEVTHARLENMPYLNACIDEGWLPWTLPPFFCPLRSPITNLSHRS